jgi:hypothetical protein
MQQAIRLVEHEEEKKQSMIGDVHEQAAGGRAELLTFLCSGAARRYSCMTQLAARAADGADAFFFRRGANVIARFTPTRRLPPPHGRGRTTGFSFPAGFHRPLAVAGALAPLLRHPPPTDAGRTAKKYFSPSLASAAIDQRAKKLQL